MAGARCSAHELQPASVRPNLVSLIHVHHIAGPAWNGRWATAIPYASGVEDPSYSMSPAPLMGPWSCFGPRP